MHPVVDPNLLNCIEDMAREGLADHVLKLIASDQSGASQIWSCRKPGSSVYAFYVTLTPSHICVFGDVGDCMLYRPHADALRWLCGSVYNHGYLMSKMAEVVQGHLNPFDPDRAKDHIRGMLDDVAEELAESLEDAPDDGEAHAELSAGADAERARIQAVIDEWDRIQAVIDEWDGNTGHSFYEAYSNNFPGDDIPDCRSLSPGGVWAVMCLRRFVELYKERDEWAVDAIAATDPTP